jgi:hypothetical protein
VLKVLALHCHRSFSLAHGLVDVLKYAIQGRAIVSVLQQFFYSIHH